VLVSMSAIEKLPHALSAYFCMATSKIGKR
jgi:hypothetical protein